MSTSATAAQFSISGLFKLKVFEIIALGIHINNPIIEKKIKGTQI
jgi:hypothetical protein